MSRRSFRRSSMLAVLFLAGLTTLTASAVDRVIFRDGFYIEGTLFKEQEQINDPVNGFMLKVPKVKGFDVIDDGLRWWIFSRHQKQAVEVQKDIKGLEDLKEYTRDAFPNAVMQDLPAMAQFKAPNFDEKWQRKFRLNLPNGSFDEMQQVIRVLGPQRMVIVSKSHRWNPYISTRELGPEAIRSLLTTHPDLDDKGKPDPTKRLLIANFFYQGDFLDAARAEVARAKKDIPGTWTKEQTETLDKLEASLSKAEAKLVVDELEVAKQAARYEGGKQLLARFDAKSATAELTNRFTKLRAELEIVQPAYEKTKRLLAASVERMSGMKVLPAGAAGGGLGAFAALKQLPEQSQKLIVAGTHVVAELHPDNADRIDIFRKLAEDTDRQTAAGKSGKRPDELIALAISGWVMGPNGADNNAENALHLWQWRETLLAYQNETILNKRRALFHQMQKTGKAVTPDVVSQLIKYLPPPQPDDLVNRGGVLIPPSSQVAAGIYRRNTGPVAAAAAGVDYLVRLPAEYHHGRSYPLIVALSHATMPPEEMISRLSYEADRNGFILAAPLWINGFDQAYDWTGDQHYKVLDTVRDLMRHYQVDNDRVSLFGFAQGANFAMDVGSSHPDLFAGLLAMGPTPRWAPNFLHYWRNCQKLPVYVALGAMAGSGLENTRKIYEEWVFRGYPGIASVYRGRATEWFSGDLHLMFDWLRVKKRITGTGVLRLNNAAAIEPFMTMRKEDNRFYWVGSDEINVQNLQNGRKGGFTPAEIKADIFQGNEIKITSRGLKTVTVCLDREMIDWTKPVKVRINSDIPRGYKAQVLKQDLEFMLEQFYEHGDRSLLFLNKLVLTP
ncbi:hypothetical protein [Limnoglobus roseus]|uniref:Alpha/beta hydrolase n=1 Tax=Limnoglobus roseus TaxID=2598579 RepID=A0A5C1AJR6_9BACT|nr:hypothetical protein [Limnoglobus roseus]QEL18427.1 alpha/beta hydrolase [Limnoglobus roseus]